MSDVFMLVPPHAVNLVLSMGGSHPAPPQVERTAPKKAATPKGKTAKKGIKPKKGAVPLGEGYVPGTWAYQAPQTRPHYNRIIPPEGTPVGTVVRGRGTDRPTAKEAQYMCLAAEETGQLYWKWLG